jgi:hypothetical protein
LLKLSGLAVTGIGLGAGPNVALQADDRVGGDAQESFPCLDGLG